MYRGGIGGVSLTTNPLARFHVDNGDIAIGGFASVSPFANCYVQANGGATLCTLFCTPSITTSARYVANITYIAVP